MGPDLHGRDLEPLLEEVAVVEVGGGGTRGPVDVTTGAPRGSGVRA